MESGQGRCWAQCAARLAGWKKKRNQKYPIKDMKTPGVVSLSVTATLLTRSNEEWVDLGIYTGAKEWLIQTRCATPAIYRNQRKPCAEREREAWENRKKTFPLFLIASGGHTGVWFGRVLPSAGLANTKRHFVFFFFCACTTKEISLEMTR